MQGADFCAWRANPLHHVLPKKSVCFYTHSAEVWTAACMQSGAWTKPWLWRAEWGHSAFSQSVAPAHPDPKNAFCTTALMRKCSFLSELSLSISTLDGELEAVQLEAGSVSLCFVQLTLRKNLWWNWEWSLDQTLIPRNHSCSAITQGTLLSLRLWWLNGNSPPFIVLTQRIKGFSSVYQLKHGIFGTIRVRVFWSDISAFNPPDIHPVLIYSVPRQNCSERVSPFQLLCRLQVTLLGTPTHHMNQCKTGTKGSHCKPNSLLRTENPQLTEQCGVEPLELFCLTPAHLFCF